MKYLECTIHTQYSDKQKRTQALTISYYRFIKYLKVCFCFTPKMNNFLWAANSKSIRTYVRWLLFFFSFRFMKNRNNNKIMATSQTKCVDEINDNVEMRMRSVSKGYQYTCYDSLAAGACSCANALWNNRKRERNIHNIRRIKFNDEAIWYM